MKNQKQPQNQKNTPVADIYISTRTSKNGKTYSALYVVDENDVEHFVAFIHKKGDK